MEIWAYCDACGRWFYCPEWFNRAKPQPVCPECYREPSAIENRAPAQPSESGSSAHGDPAVSGWSSRQPVRF